MSRHRLEAVVFLFAVTLSHAQFSGFADFFSRALPLSLNAFPTFNQGPITYTPNDTVIKSDTFTQVIKPNGDIIQNGPFGVQRIRGDDIRNFFRNSAPSFVQVGSRQPDYFGTGNQNRQTVVTNRPVQNYNNNNNNNYYQPTTTQRPPSPPVSAAQGNCGRSRFASPFIVGGEPSQAGEWPWFGSLFVDESGRRLKLLCGVSLLTQKHVLTAAHCIESPREPYRYSVMLGRHNIADQRERNFQQRAVSALVIHGEYASRQQRSDADIAVLKLKSAVTFTDFVQPVCLPKASIDFKDVRGTVVGYGKSEDYSDHTTIPRKISVQAVDLYTCLYSDSAFVQIASKRTFCAGGLGKSPCKGDSGGGFYVRDSRTGQWIIYGMVSEGLILNGFCDTQKYVVFTDVTKYLRWIYQTLNQLATDACDPSPCGANSECFVFGDGHFCECLEGFQGDPEKGCTR